MKQENNVQMSKGKFGYIFKDIWGNMPNTIKILYQHPDTMPVAIKRPSEHPESEQFLEHEIAIHRRLSHPNIVVFLGELDESSSSEKGLVMELVLGGDLVDMINNHKGPVSYSLQLTIACDIARGLNYLHEINILHRDIKPDNILIEKQGEATIAKICDFGFAVSTKDNAEFDHLQGTPEYLAPELLQSASSYPYTIKSDIYAFALIMWVLTSKQNPHQQAKSNSHLVQLVKAGQRDDIPNNTSSDYANLITDCWKQNPDHRPQTLEIINRLTEMPGAVKTVTETPLSIVRKNSGLTTCGLFAGITIAFVAASTLANSYSSKNG